MIVRNGKCGIGFRLDDLRVDGPTGMELLENPFAIVPEAKNANRIVEAFELLTEFLASQDGGDKGFRERVRAVVGV